MKFNLFKRKDGKCRWWNHKYIFESREEIKLGTGKYIGDKEIKQLGDRQKLLTTNQK